MKINPKTPLLIFLFFFSTFSFAQTTSAMTYNIRYDTPNDGENWWEKRKEAVVALIDYYNPDFFGIQEGLDRQVKYLDSSLTNYKYIGVGRDDGKTKGEYSAIFYNASTYSPIKQSTFWLSEEPDKVSVGWDASMERICTYALFQHIASGKKLWVFNVHYDHIGVLAREMSSKLIIKKIKELNTEGLPVLLTGDFNSTPETNAIQTIGAELKDSFTSTYKKHYGPIGTFSGFDPEKILDNRIDYVFTKNIDVISHIHIDDKRPDGYFVSDHLPVLVELEFKK